MDAKPGRQQPQHGPTLPCTAHPPLLARPHGGTAATLVPGTSLDSARSRSGPLIAPSLKRGTPFPPPPLFPTPSPPPAPPPRSRGGGSPCCVNPGGGSGGLRGVVEGNGFAWGVGGGGAGREGGVVSGCVFFIFLFAGACSSGVLAAAAACVKIGLTSATFRLEVFPLLGFFHL